MTHEELLALLNAKSDSDEVHALRAVVGLHKPEGFGGPERCRVEGSHYPCSTIEAIKKELE